MPKGRKTYTLAPYSPEVLVLISERLQTFEDRYPDSDPIELRIREILSRLKGEAGLTETKVLYLLGCIMRVVNEDNETFTRVMGPAFYD